MAAESVYIAIHTFRTIFSTRVHFVHATHSCIEVMQIENRSCLRIMISAIVSVYGTACCPLRISYLPYMHGKADGEIYAAVNMKQPSLAPWHQAPLYMARSYDPCHVGRISIAADASSAVVWVGPWKHCTGGVVQTCMQSIELGGTLSRNDRGTCILPQAVYVPQSAF
jgi:hypothetical protein